MNCTKCNQKAKVINSRKSADPKGRAKIPAEYLELISTPFIHRSLKCLSCENTFQTIEIDARSLVSKIRTINAVYESAEEIMNSIKTIT